MSAAVVLVIVGIALMFIGWATTAGDLSNIVFLVGLVIALAGVVGAITRRY